MTWSPFCKNVINKLYILRKMAPRDGLEPPAKRLTTAFSGKIFILNSDNKKYIFKYLENSVLAKATAVLVHY